MLRLCEVSFTDTSGVKHSAEVTAETLYEAAVLGVKAITTDCEEQPGNMTTLEVTVKAAPVRHEIKYGRVLQWLDGNCRSPKEKVLKERLKALL